MKKVLSLLLILSAVSSLFFISCNKDNDDDNVTTPVNNVPTGPDSICPVITLNGSQNMTISLNSNYNEPGYSAVDNVSGNITSSVVVTGTVNKNLRGTYILTYTVSDASGNKDTAIRNVKVENDAIYLQGTYDVTDVISGLTYTYTDNITVDNTTNKKIWVAEFAYYYGASVYFTVNNNTITLPSQTVSCGMTPVNRLFSGSGTINGTTITLNYTETTNGTTANGVETYVKQ